MSFNSNLVIYILTFRFMKFVTCMEMNVRNKNHNIYEMNNTYIMKDIQWMNSMTWINVENSIT
jgi:hypothetical protein